MPGTPQPQLTASKLTVYDFTVRRRQLVWRRHNRGYLMAQIVGDNVSDVGYGNGQTFSLICGWQLTQFTVQDDAIHPWRTGRLVT